jgi:hypothetical protein
MSFRLVPKSFWRGPPQFKVKIQMKKVRMKQMWTVRKIKNKEFFNKPI